MPPAEQQAANESLKLWGGVTEAILAKKFSQATTVKQQLEEAQRDKARERDRTGEAWKPVFFETVVGNSGKPELTEKGRKVLENAQQGEWSLEGLL